METHCVQISISRTCRTMRIYRKIMGDYGLCLMNKSPTWFTNNRKSLIDHITTNMHQHIDNIATTQSGISKHSMVSFSLSTTENVDNPKYHRTQNWENANPLDAELLTSFHPFLNKYGQ